MGCIKTPGEVGQIAGHLAAEINSTFATLFIIRCIIASHDSFGPLSYCKQRMCRAWEQGYNIQGLMYTLKSDIIYVLKTGLATPHNI